MPRNAREIADFLQTVHPYDSLDLSAREELAGQITLQDVPKGSDIYALGARIDALFVIWSGDIDVFDETGTPLSHLHSRNSFGERALLAGGITKTSAIASSDALLMLIPAQVLAQLQKMHPAIKRFFDRARPDTPRAPSLATRRVEDIMSTPPICCTSDTSVRAAAIQMREARVSALCVVDHGGLNGIVTLRDLSHKILAEARSIETPIREIMTQDPLTLPPSSIGSDVLHLMMEKRIGHVPICEAGKLVGIVTQTDLTRVQAINSGELVAEIARAQDATSMARVTARIPGLLRQLVGTGLNHDVVTRLITDIADAATRRLLALGEQTLGPAPIPYVWLACGSQGRQEQTGVSDQDNCLILSDDAAPGHEEYFSALADFVCDGLNICGYVYCPGDMMASNPRWRQPLGVWRGYFDKWISTPDKEAQMLASVMFDLRVIGGDETLFADLKAQTLGRAAKNSIFVGHMIANSLGHTPPLGLFRGFATMRSGEHKDHIDLKHNGVVPVVDLGRVYALQGALGAVNTRARLEAAEAAGILSTSGGADLIAAYDLIAQTRLEQQASQIKQGQAPDNYLDPTSLPDFERSHLRDAFVVIKTMQSAIGHGRGMLG